LVVVLLLGVGFVCGLVTGISPCILPVLPAIVAGSSARPSRWRAISITAGLVASFTLITLVGSSLLGFLGLPQDFTRNLGLAVLGLLAVGLMVPQLGHWIERPFARLGASRTISSAGGFVLGASLGFVFVPCAGPVLSAITTVAGEHRVGPTAVWLTAAYAIGAAVPLLVLGVLAQRATASFVGLRDRMPLVRRVAGVILAGTTLAIAFNVTDPLQRAVPGYTTALQNSLGGSGSAHRQLQALTGERANPFAKGHLAAASMLPKLGLAPDFTDITAWLNTPGDRPLSLAGLRGKVVLVDFWTYSCINCQRSLPHVEAWYRDYRADGLVVVGVHTPEFPFEHVVGNVQAADGQLGVHYPVAIDGNYATWNAYGNEYWPAEYLIDQTGEVRHVQFGEGDYGATERAIRTLLGIDGAALPRPTEVANRTPTGAITPETYLGYERISGSNYTGTRIAVGRPNVYQLAGHVPANYVSFGGTFTVGPWAATAGTKATMELNFMARDVYLVLGGTGTVQTSVGGGRASVTEVAGLPRLYTLVSGSDIRSGLLHLRLSPGVQAYDFTFG
jgi:cytochrome c biogenesis protein CcdA/thiol-disulfide isomerase/thioredoxin